MKINYLLPQSIKKIKYILKGIGTFFPFSLARFFPQHQPQFYNRGCVRQSPVSARTCYSIWMRNLITLKNEGLLSDKMKIFAEIGPGDSLGIGLMALLSGFNEYYAIDFRKTAFNNSNLKILKDLIDLLSSKTAIPDNNELPKAEPILKDYNFPVDFFTEERRNLLLDKKRIEKIKKVLNRIIDGESEAQEDEISVHYIITDEIEKIKKQSVDLVYSVAVMEHVEDTKKIYSQISRILKNGGVFAHIIDFKSHGSASLWNGHWTYSDIIWKLVRGRSVYFINRKPFSWHVKEIKDSGCSVLCTVLKNKENKINRKSLIKEFKKICDSDLEICSAFIAGAKNVYEN